MIYQSVIELVGNTPLIKLNLLKEKLNLKSDIYAKLEYFNPTGSVKDRIAKQMLLDAYNKGLITKNTTIIEPTSGNTGIGLASLSKALGLKVIIVMPESMSIERRNFIKAYGATIVLSDASLGMKGAIAKAKELNSTIKDSFIPSQFENESNPIAHYNTTGPEIYKDLQTIDYFVAGIGTGGTITGTAKYLHEQIPSLITIGVEPKTSPVITQGISGPHKIQGIGAGFIPKVLDLSICNEVHTISNEDAFSTEKLLSETEGLFVGISSGAALKAAIEIAESETNKNIVVILPDNGDRYFSMLF